MDNFNPALTTHLAILLSLLAAFLWGTWFISIKYLGSYPLDGFYITLFSTSLVFVWCVAFLIDGRSLTGNIQAIYQIAPLKIWATIFCGILYVLGMRITLYVFQTIGLALSQPIQASTNILVGTWIAAIFGGIPPNLSSVRTIAACLLLFIAVLMTLLAGKYRNQAQESNQLKSNLQFTMREMWRATYLLAISSLLAPAYTLGLSYGLRSITQPVGLAVLPFMALLSTGAFLGSMFSSGLLLTLRKQWSLVLNAPFSLHKLGMISGIFHYGGNIIHTFATVSLSSVISWPLGVTYGLWTQVWGIVFGEFKGAPRKTYIALGLAILFYLAGAFLIANAAG